MRLACRICGVDAILFSLIAVHSILEVFGLTTNGLDVTNLVDYFVSEKPRLRIDRVTG